MFICRRDFYVRIYIHIFLSPVFKILPKCQHFLQDNSLTLLVGILEQIKYHNLNGILANQINLIFQIINLLAHPTKSVTSVFSTTCRYLKDVGSSFLIYSYNILLIILFFCICLLAQFFAPLGKDNNLKLLGSDFYSLRPNSC